MGCQKDDIMRPRVILVLYMSTGLVFPAEGLTASDDTKDTPKTIFMEKYLERLPYTTGDRTFFWCDTSGGRPTPTFSWTINDEPIQGGRVERHDRKENSRSRIVFHVDKNMDGGVLKCVAYNGAGDSLADNTTLHVLYPPDVSLSVTYNNTQTIMVCNAKGNPSNYTFHTYYHGLDNSSTSYPLSGNSTGSEVSIVLNNLTYEDTGYFFCSVANGIRNAGKGSILVEPRTKPLFFSVNNSFETMVGSDLDIIYDLYARPFVTTIEFKKYHPDHDLRNTLLEIPLEPVNISLKIKSGTFDLPGQRAMIRLDNVTLEDSGNYSIIGTNTQGSSAVFVTITVHKIEAPPEPGPVESGGIGAGIVVLIVVIMLNMMVLGALLYRRYRRMKPKRFVAKVHGDAHDTSKFLAGPDDVHTTTKNPIFRQKKKSHEPSAKSRDQENYAELDFSHVSKNNEASEVKRKDPPTEYAWIDFSRPTPIRDPETSFAAS